MRHVIVQDNPVDGISMIGPFNSFEEAQAETHTMLPDYTPYWIAEIEPVKRSLSLDTEVIDVLNQYVPSHIVEHLLHTTPTPE